MRNVKINSKNKTTLLLPEWEDFMMFSREIKKYSSKKLLEDELVNVKLFDNHSFQFILDRELQRRMKSKASKQDQKLK